MKNNLMTRKNINVDKANNIPIASFKQEDDVVLKLALFSNGVALDCTNQTFKLGATRRDGTLIELTTGYTINKNEIDIILTNNIIAVPGIIECDLEVKDASGKLTTASFFITSNKKVLGENNVSGTNEVGALEKVNKWLDESKEMLDYVNQNMTELDGVKLLKGDKGDIGPAGPIGKQGPQGIQGQRGEPGLGATQLELTKQDKTDNTLNTNSKSIPGAINELSASLDNKANQIKLRNSIKLDLPSYDGGNQGVHPKVVFRESGWNGYKYWMSYAPFTNSDDMKENPCILASNDGIEWVIPSGLVNPIDTAPSYPRFFSDTHLLINENNVMECWYRQLYKDEVPEKEMIWRKTSSDGVNWSNAELLHKVETSNRGSLLSPSIIRENGKYKIYCLELMASVGCRLKLYESLTGNNWTLVKSFDDFKIEITGYNMWHLDVEKTEKGYEMLVSTNMPVAEIFYSSSIDGLSFTPFVKFMERGVSGSFDEGRLYRSCILRDSRGYKIYYSAFDRNDKCGIGLISCTTNNIFDVVGLQYSDTMSKSNLITKTMSNIDTTGITKLGQFGYLLQEGLKMLRSGIAHCIIRPAKVKGVDGVEVVDVNYNPINLTAKSIVATTTVETPSLIVGNTVIDTTNIKLVKSGVTQSYQSCGGTGGELIASNSSASDGLGIYTASKFRFLTTSDEGQFSFEKGNTSLGRPSVMLMKDIDGTTYKVPTVRYIPTSQRPADPYNGFSYFDTTLGKMVYRHSGKWVDALGTQV